MTREETQAVIDRMKTAKPTCDNCETFVQHVRGSEPFPHKFGYFKRCQSCEQSFLYPWAAQLDVDKVLAFIERNEPLRGVIDCSELKETL